MSTIAWDEILEHNHVDSTYLDCYSNNLAVLMTYLGVEDIRTPFAYQWFFDFNSNYNEELPLIMDKPIEAIIQQQTGCVLLKFPSEQGQVVSRCCDLQHQYGPLLVLGDAYFMSWLPYFGHEHMLHSFIIAELDSKKCLFHIVDAYHNKTEWGEARSADLWIPMCSVEPIMMSSDAADKTPFRVLQKGTQPEALDFPPLLRQQAERILDQTQGKKALLAFCNHYKERASDIEAVKRFVLACWLVARQRALHQLWLNDLSQTSPRFLASGYSTQFQLLVSTPWQKISEFSYILLRRVKLGRKPIDTCFQMLEEVIIPGEIQAATLLLQAL